MHRRYPSKLLLLGEHTVLKGSQALAFPFKRFSGFWTFNPKSTVNEEHRSLQAFCNYLDTIQIGIKVVDFRRDLESGLTFTSSIPRGYGLGSSGALCAAVYDKYYPVSSAIEGSSDLNLLKSKLAKMESFYHGSSSGTDPLVSYAARPILIDNPKPVTLLEVQGQIFSEMQFFLLDTKLTRDAGMYIRWFVEQYDQQGTFQKKNQEDLIPCVNQAIKSVLAMDGYALYKAWQSISEYQFDLFQYMVPEEIKPTWLQGLNTGKYYLKLCGAGGGGFLLGLTRNFEETAHGLSDWNLIRIRPQDIAGELS